MDGYVLMAYNEEGFYGYVVYGHKNGKDVYEYTDSIKEATEFSFDEAYEIRSFLTEKTEFSLLIKKVH